MNDENPLTQAPQGKPDPPLKRLWTSLSKEENFTIGYDEFAADMEDAGNLRSLHTELAKRRKDFTIGYDEFAADMGLFKKKSLISASGAGSPNSELAGWTQTSDLAAGVGEEMPAGTPMDAPADVPTMPSGLPEQLPSPFGGPVPESGFRSGEFDNPEQFAQQQQAAAFQQQMDEETGAPGTISPRQSALTQQSADALQAAGAGQPAAEEDGFWSALGKNVGNIPAELNNVAGNVVDFAGDLAQMLNPYGFKRQFATGTDYLTTLNPTTDDKWTDRAGAIFRKTGKGIEFELSANARKSVLDEPTNPAAWGNLYGGAAKSLVVIGAAGLLGGPAAAAGTGGSMSVSGVKDAAREAGVSDDEATLTALLVAPVVGVLEGAGFGSILRAGPTNALLKRALLRKALEFGQGRVTKEAMAKAAAYVTPRLLARGAKGGVGEMLTEIAQGEVEGGSQYAADRLRSADAPGKYGISALDAFVKKPLEQGLAGFGAGMGASVALGGHGSPTDQNLPTATEIGSSATGPAPAADALADIPAEQQQAAAAAYPAPVQIVRPTGQVMFPAAQVVGLSPDGSMARVVGQDGQGQPFSLNVPAEYIQPTQPLADAPQPSTLVPELSGPEPTWDVPPADMGLLAPAAPEAVLPDNPQPAAADTVEPAPAQQAVAPEAAPLPEAAAPPAPAYGSPAENRAAGRFEKDGVTYERAAPLAQRGAVFGNETSVEFASGVQQPVRYALVEAADVQPSHANGAPNLNHFLPEAQPKNRTAAFDPASREAVRQIAQAPDAGRLAAAPNAYSGAPVVNGRGEALQGNGRTDGVQEHYRQGGTEYKAQITAQAVAVGIPAEAVAAMREPMLVRVADVSDSRARELGNYTAADTESGGQRRLDVRQAANRLDETGRADLTRLLTPADGVETLTETIRRNSEPVVRLLRKAGLANPTQLQTMLTPEGGLKPNGVEDIADLYRQLLFVDGDPNLPERYRELPAAARNGLDRAVGAIVSLPEAVSILPEVQAAVMGVRELVASGVDFGTWAGQSDMFQGGLSPQQRFSPLELQLVDLLAREKRPTYIARAFVEYAAAVKGETATLFGDTPPLPRPEAVQQVFNVADNGRQPTSTNSSSVAATQPGATNGRPAPPATSAVETAPAARPAAGVVGPDSGPDGSGKPVASAAGTRSEVVRVGRAYQSPDGTRFEGQGAKRRAEYHAQQVGMVGKKVRGYGGSIDVVESVRRNDDGQGYTYTVRGTDGVQRTHGGGIDPKQLVADETAGALDVRSSGAKQYADLALAPRAAQSGRIQPDVIRGETPKPLASIVLDLRRATGATVFFTRRPAGAKTRALGSYNPSNAAVAVKAGNDLDVTAHEIGHYADDKYSLLPKAPAAALAEIAPLAQFGSQPTATHPNPAQYTQGEAVAEWVRAYLVNPAQTRSDFPQFTAHYEATVPATFRKQVEAFGRDIRVFAGATAHEQMMANVRMKPEAQGGLLARLKPNTSSSPFMLTWADRVDAAMLNSMRPFEKAFEYARQVAGEPDVQPENNPVILARVFLGVNDKFDNILREGLVDSRNERVIDPVTNSPMNLTWLLEPLDRTTAGTVEAEQQQVISYMIAERTVELSQQFGREAALTGVGGGLFTDLDVAAARVRDVEDLAQTDPAAHARILEAARRYQAFADANLQYLVERGRMSQEQYDAIKKNSAQYVALQRVMEAEPGEEIKVFSGGGQTLTAPKQTVRTIKGSDRTIKNPYSSLLDGTYKMVKEADRNAVLQSFREWFVGGRQMYDGAPDELAAVARPAAQGDPHTLSIFVDGVREYWQLDADVFRALSELGNTPQTGLMGKVLQSPGVLLRWTVTHSPVFAVRNVLRDAQGRMILSTTTPETGFDLLYDKQARQDTREGYALAGGGQAGYYLTDEGAYYTLMQEEMRRLASQKNNVLVDPGRWAKGAWKAYTKVLSGSETIGRHLEYRSAFKSAKAKGMDDYNASLYAAYQARDLMDFAVAGTVMREINKYIPFTNAAVQGLRKAVRSAKENPGGMAVRWMLYAVAPAVLVRTLVHALDRDDEYAQLPAYQRDFFYNIPKSDGGWIVIPRPFELGVLANSAERFLSAQGYDDPRAWEGYGGSVAKSLIPLDEAAVAGGLRPVVEAATNYDFFRDKNIIPPGEMRKDLLLRHTERASRLGQWIGRPLGIDARMVDHLIGSSTSYFGGWAMKASNWGREDGGQSFTATDTGFLKQDPVAQARDVQWAQRYLERYGASQGRIAKRLQEHLSAYYEERRPEQKRRLGRLVRVYATLLRDVLDAPD